MRIIRIVIFLICSVATISSLAAKRYAEHYCDDPNYTCIRINSGQTWNNLFPDPYQRQLVKRLNRMNIRLARGMQIAIPNNLAQADLMSISPFPKLIDSVGRKMVVVDPNVMAWAAYDSHGNMMHWGPMSGGKNYCRDIKRGCRTISGRFKFYHKRGAECKSSKFPLGRGGAPMPYCMFFHAGFAMHASPVVPGYHASHGCVRIFNEDARWLNEEFIDIGGPKSTLVIVNPY